MNSLKYVVSLITKIASYSPDLSAEKLIKIIILKLRHAVVCQRPRKPRDAQVCYLHESPFTPFQPIIA